MLFRFDGFRYVNVMSIQCVAPKQSPDLFWKAHYYASGFEYPLGPSFPTHRECANWLSVFLAEDSNGDTEFLRLELVDYEIWKKRALTAEARLAEIETSMIMRLREELNQGTTAT